MKKFYLLIFIVLALGLTACIPNTEPAATSTAPLSTPITTITTPTTEVKPSPTVALIVPTQSVFLPDPGCTVIAREPTPGPTAESIFPPVSETDHVKGPDTAAVTFIEYSDFQ